MTANPAMLPELRAVPSPVIYFFSGRSTTASLAFERVRAAHPECEWRHHVLRSNDEQTAFEAGNHAPDVLISFLSGYIVKPALLDAVQGRAFNVHPAPPEYPGRDPWHFAYYDRFPRAGATLHRMAARVDEGEILDVVERDFDLERSVTQYRALCHELSVELLIENLDGMLDGTIQPRSSRSWHVQAKRSRRDFSRMCEIDPAMSPDEVARRVRSFSTPEHDNVYVVIHGHKFFYKRPGEA